MDDVKPQYSNRRCEEHHINIIDKLCLNNKYIIILSKGSRKEIITMNVVVE